MLKYLTKFKFIFYIVIYLLSFLNQSISKTKESNSELKFRVFNENLNRFLNCTNEKVELIPYSYSKYKDFIFVFEDLNLDCLSKTNKNISEKNKDKNNEYFLKMFKGKVYDEKYEVNLINSEEDDIFYEIISLYNPFSFYGVCGESCSYGKEQIIKLNNKFYYQHISTGGFDNKGIVQNQNLIRFAYNTLTFASNSFLNINKSFFGYLPNGTVKLYNSYYEVYDSKTYFDGGGAFLYNAKISYEGALLQLIPEETNILAYTKRCISADRFGKYIKDYLLKMNRKEYCPYIYKP